MLARIIWSLFGNSYGVEKVGLAFGVSADAPATGNAGILPADGALRRPNLKTCRQDAGVPSRWRVICLRLGICALVIFASTSAFAETPLLVEKPTPADFPLVTATGAATILYSGADAKTVSIAARNLADDIERVTGKRASVIAISATAAPAGNAGFPLGGRREAPPKLPSGNSALPDSTLPDSTLPDSTLPDFTLPDSTPVVLIGAIGQSPLIDSLVASGKLAASDVSKIKGQWESFLIATLDAGASSGPRMLVIAGSDPRGTAFGVYELSQAIGVSPWHWWADVTPAKRATLAIAAGARRYGPPSVKYRGIFIGDEDWGLQPWAAKNFEPENKGIGPKTYARVFELLLRLKANTLWPAMRRGTPPFNSNPANAALAADYGIVMGSSPAEPMLRNPATEWNGPIESFNYATTRDAVRAFWEERVKASAGREGRENENIYTLGMGDTPPPDNASLAPALAEQVALLEKVFADQRALIASNASASASSATEGQAPAPAPQMFCVREEVFDIVRAGLRVPDDVTLMFTDDGYGYIRNFPTGAARGGTPDSGLRTPAGGRGTPDGAAGAVDAVDAATGAAPAPARQRPIENRESKIENPPAPTRAGGYGIYYHVSYLGAPLSYLWLCTTPPALIWEEMSKACDLGADRMWILNVGDIKPAEIDIEFFLQMAWDIRRWNADTLPNFLPEWAAREFGPDYAASIGALMEQYYTYNFARRPEHLQWWLPGEALVPSALSSAERDSRRDAGLSLTAKLGGLRDRIPAEKQDAFYELVDYPVQAAVLASNRYFTGETAALKALSGDYAALDKLGNLGDVLNGQLARVTHRYNVLTAGAKWNGIMQLEPADDRYKSVRITAWHVPAFKRPLPPEIRPPLAVAQPDTGSIIAGKTSAWRPIRGLGQSGNACALIPASAPAIPPERAAAEASVLVFNYTLTSAPRDGATITARIHILPTHASDNSGKYRLAYAFDAAPASAPAPAPQFIERSINDGGPAWEQGVLSNERIIIIALPPAARAAGAHKLNLYGLSPGMVIDRVTIE